MITQSLVTTCAGISDGRFASSDTAEMLTETIDELLIYRVNFMVKPNGLLVLVSSTHYCAYTSSLSTW